MYTETVEDKQSPDQHESFKLSTSSDPRHNSNTVLIGIIAVLLVIIAFCAGYFFSQQSINQHNINAHQLLGPPHHVLIPSPNSP